MFFDGQPVSTQVDSPGVKNLGDTPDEFIECIVIESRCTTGTASVASLRDVSLLTQ
ncbi:hypothetical protein KEM60_03348 [Austwickia sp. TVS 96-490-7B]|nr:hypothetical protein [Austwickia sp. TVS 96-490-7B]